MASRYSNPQHFPNLSNPHLLGSDEKYLTSRISRSRCGIHSIIYELNLKDNEGLLADYNAYTDSINNAIQPAPPSSQAMINRLLALDLPLLLLLLRDRLRVALPMLLVLIPVVVLSVVAVVGG